MAKGFQMLVLQRYFIMQPAIAAAGAAEMLLAWLWQWHAHLVY